MVAAPCGGHLGLDHVRVLRWQARVSFRALAGQTVDEVIATFLAVLELFRRGLIQVEQSAPFDDLTLIMVAP